MNENSNKLINNINYLNFYIEGYKNLINNNFSNCLNCYKECIKIIEKSNDFVKISDSICNYSIFLFYFGKIDESLIILKKGLEISYKIKENNKNFYEIRIKILINLSLINYYLNKFEDLFENIHQIINIIDSLEFNEKNKLFKNVINNFFMVDSLIFLEEDLKTYDLINNSQNKLNIKFLYAFNKYLKNKNLEEFKNFFNEEIQFFDENKKNNFNFIFLTFYNNILNENKEKITNLNNIIINNNKENLILKNSEKIINLFKIKLEKCCEIYNIFYEKEKELYENNKKIERKSNEISNKSLKFTHFEFENKPCSPILIKLLINYSINLLKNNKFNNINIENKNILLNNLIYTNQLILNDQIDLSEIHLSDFDKNISNSLIILFGNIIFIYQKNILLKNLRIYKKNVFNIKNKENLLKIENFCKENYIQIKNGQTLTKINLKSNGLLEHFYKIEKENFLIYKNKDENEPKKIINLNKIRKFLYGIKSKNIKNKFVNINNDYLNSPFLFLSLITKKRSFDLYLPEIKLKNWIFGLFYYYFYINKLNYKLFSINNFILTRIKLKSIKKLKEFSHKKNKIKIENDKKLIYEISIQKNLQNFSFIKSILLFNSIIPL